MEVSSHALALGRVDGTTFDVAVFTNLSQDHLDFHADLEEYFAGQGALFTPAAVPARRRRRRRRVRPAAGRARRPCRSSRSRRPAARRRLAGRGRRARAGGQHASRSPARTACGSPARTALPGDFNVANAALAVVALVAGRGRPGARPRPASRPARACPAGWSGSTTGAGGPLAVVDYAHSPDAVERLLATARGLVADGGRLIVVLGCGGDRDRQQAAGDGRDRGRGADVAVLTSDNPRSEDPPAILAAMRRGRRRGAGRRRRRAGRGRAGPARGDRAGRRRWPGRATSWWSPARATSRARRSPAWCTRSTTGSCSREALRGGRRA